MRKRHQASGVSKLTYDLVEASLLLLTELFTATGLNKSRPSRTKNYHIINPPQHDFAWICCWFFSAGADFGTRRHCQKIRFRCRGRLPGQERAASRSITRQRRI